MTTNGFQNFDQLSWARSLQTTMPDIIRDVEDASKRNFQVMALLDAAGRITTNHGGEGIQWPAKYKNHKAYGATGENTRNFTPTNLWKQGTLDYRGYEVTDSIKRREMEKNKGDAAVIKVIDQFSQRLTDSLLQELGPQFYTDGEAAGNEHFWHGFLTMAQSNGQTINLADGTVRAKDQGDKVIHAEGKYANLMFQLGQYGGEQKTDGVPWPEGLADAQFDFWTPLQVMIDSTAFGDGTNPGRDLELALRYGITHAQRNSSIEGQMTNVWLDRGLFIDLKNYNDDRQTIEVTQTGDASLIRLGFRNVLIFDGLEVSWEVACPIGHGFGINLQCLELLALTADLFEVEGPEYDIHTQSFNAVVSTLSNLKYKSPRNFCVWKKFADA